MDVTNFRKIVNIAHFMKSYFSMKVGNVEKWVYHYFDENNIYIIYNIYIYISHSKNIGCILMYIEIHGGKHYVYIFYVVLLHYFFSKNI